MPLGRPPQRETSQIIRQIPRVEPFDAVEAPEEPPRDPSEPFIWTSPSEPEPGTLRPIRALIGDTFRFIARQWRPLLAIAPPAAAAVILSWLSNQWGYEQVFDDIPRNTSGLRLALGAALSILVLALGTYFFSIAVANLVAQHSRNEPTRGTAVARIAIRKLPRVTVINLVYGLALAVVYVPLQFLIYPSLFDAELGYVTPWLWMFAGIVAYGAPPINLYFTAIKLEDPRPKFRRARYLVRGKWGAVLGRVLLCQIVVVALEVVWDSAGLEFQSVAWAVSRIFFVVAGLTILTTAFTLLYVDLAGVRAEEAAMGDGATTPESLDTGGSDRAHRPT